MIRIITHYVLSGGTTAYSSCTFM